MNLLSHRVVLAEIVQLVNKPQHGDQPLVPDDFSFDGDVLVCKDIPGGLKLTDEAKQLAIATFSYRLLVPFLTRMARLKALRADLVALGVIE